MLSDVAKGVPHAAHVLPKYQKFTDGRAVVLPPDDDFLRTFDRCKEQNDKYEQQKVENAKKADAINFDSCEHAPLLTGGHVIDTVSTTPLHISLGLGHQALNVVEGEAIELDNEIKKREGKYDAFSIVFDRKKEILKNCQNINEKIEEVDEKIDHVVERKKEIIQERGSFFKQNKGKYVNNSDLAKGVRKTFDNLGKEKVSLLDQKEKLKKQLAAQEKKLSAVLDELKKITGPFKTRLDEVLEGMKLKRAAYHSGALIGPDVKKLVTKENIAKIGDVFKPMEMKLNKDGNFEVLEYFGTDALRVKIVAYLTKLRLCYELYTANRVLCRHEVELLALRCASFGCWLPVNFPELNLRRKFHLLTVDVPKQARRLKTVGMLTEQTIESIHPYINELDRRFAKVADKTQK